MSKPHVTIQREVAKDVLQDFIISNTQFDIRTFSATDVIGWQTDIQRTMAIFCSIENARRVSKFQPSALWLPYLPTEQGIMHWNWYSTAIPSIQLLNPIATILPFGHIMKNQKYLVDQYGENLFLKPNSPWKPFTGLTVNKNNLQYELSSLAQLEHVFDGELVVITNAKDIASVEYRCWCIDEKVITSAPYSWDKLDNIPDTPLEVIELAEKATWYTTEYNNCMVIDIATLADGTPKIIELNAFSTSGWYVGMDVEKLLFAMKDQ